jgi:hypothetical protein
MQRCVGCCVPCRAVPCRAVRCRVPCRVHCDGGLGAAANGHELRPAFTACLRLASACARVVLRPQVAVWQCTHADGVDVFYYPTGAAAVTAASRRTAMHCTVHMRVPAFAPQNPFTQTHTHTPPQAKWRRTRPVARRRSSFLTARHAWSRQQGACCCLDGSGEWHAWRADCVPTLLSTIVLHVMRNAGTSATWRRPRCRLPCASSRPTSTGCDTLLPWVMLQIMVQHAPPLS